MVVNAFNIVSKTASHNNSKTVSTFPPCKRGASCPKCSRRRLGETMENTKGRLRKGTLLEAFRKAVNALDDLDLVPRAKKSRLCRRRPAALTIYVKSKTEKVYNAIRLNQKTVEELKQALGDKYNFSSSCVTNMQYVSNDRCQKRKRERRVVDITEEIVQNFDEEDDFLLDLAYDIKTGECDIKLIKGVAFTETKAVQRDNEIASKMKTFSA